jgi:hypothetical protein
MRSWRDEVQRTVDTPSVGGIFFPDMAWRWEGCLGYLGHILIFAS